MAVKTDKILEYFDKLNEIPRCSKNEARVREWLQAWAAQRGLAADSDSAGNLVVRVPGSPGLERHPKVIIQGHMDMVCEKTPDSPHDFSKDPIRSIKQEDWLTADRTTLGADNGIAIAYALALAEDLSIQRPPLELLFTVDEETGLTGVKELPPAMISGRMLINLDSEDEGVFTIGCAGGVDTVMTKALQTEPMPKSWTLHRVVVGGLRGGHSGIDIDKQRGNANRILARTLLAIDQGLGCQVAELKGGTRHNAIARDAEAIIACEPANATKLAALVAQMEQTIQREYLADEAGLFITVESSGQPMAAVLTQPESRRVVQLLLALPHGVAAMSPTLKGLVETSSNLAAVEIKAQQLRILTSQRSSVTSRLAAMTEMVHAVAELAGAQAQDQNQYPPWPSDLHAPLLKTAKATYQRLFAKEPVIQVIHAGLECAIIGDRCQGMQMLSLGPTIENPHSPNERLFIPSVEKVWRFLVGLLEALGH